MKYSLSQSIILRYEIFQRNEIIETTAAHFFQKRQIVKLEMFSD